MKTLKTGTWFFLFLWPTLVQATRLPEGCLPNPRDRMLVLDLADLLTPIEEQRLNNRLLAFMDSTSNVLAVVTHPDFCGLAPYAFATEAGQEWGVGRADLDNGLVMAIKPRSGSEAGQVFVAVGRGLEGAIPDVAASRVVRLMTPSFAQGAWLRGIESGLKPLMALAAGEISIGDYLDSGPSNPAGGLWILMLFILFMFGLPGFAVFSSVRRRARINRMDFWPALLLFMASQRAHRGRYRQFQSGTGSFGSSGLGSSGGGFGGFGGGSFGGGGAGGSF